MPGPNTFPIRSQDPQQAAFAVELERENRCVVRWQYPLPRGTGLAAALFLVIFGCVAVGVVSLILQLPYPLGMFASVLGCIPLVILFVFAFTYWLDDRSERLVITADRIEHDAATRVTRAIYNSVEQYRDVQAQGYPVPGPSWLYRGGRRFNIVLVPEMYRDNIRQVEFRDFGEGPECVIHGHGGMAMVVGPFLRSTELRSIAVAIRKWKAGGTVAEFADQLRKSLEYETSTDAQRIRHVGNGMARWQQLLESPPIPCSVTQSPDTENAALIELQGTKGTPSGLFLSVAFLFVCSCFAGFVWTVSILEESDGKPVWLLALAAAVVVAFAVLRRMFRSVVTTLRFTDSQVEFTQSVLGRVRRLSLPIDQIVRIRQIYGSHLIIEQGARTKHRVSLLNSDAEVWFAELIACRADVPFWKSKVHEYPGWRDPTSRKSSASGSKQSSPPKTVTS